jgi:ribulose-5-phosphate 4-epimerase/fuculose-1-phosphate aldolase
LDDVRDLLIRNVRLGGDLAEYLSKPGSASTSANSSSTHHSVVLMRGHGYTVAGSSPEDAIYRAIYTKENAAIQTASLGVAHFGGGKDKEVQYLREDELEDTEAMVQTAWSRAWGLWLREVEATNLYKYTGK